MAAAAVAVAAVVAVVAVAMALVVGLQSAAGAALEGDGVGDEGERVHHRQARQTAIQVAF